MMSEKMICTSSHTSGPRKSSFLPRGTSTTVVWSRARRAVALLSVAGTTLLSSPWSPLLEHEFETSKNFVGAVQLAGKFSPRSRVGGQENQHQSQEPLNASQLSVQGPFQLQNPIPADQHPDEYTGKGDFKLVPHTLRLMQEQKLPGPFYIAAIHGVQRAGKSTLLSFLARRILQLEVGEKKWEQVPQQVQKYRFATSNQLTSHTKGHWICWFPFRGGTMILMDSEGASNPGRDEKFDPKLFSFTYGLASVVMFRPESRINDRTALRMLTVGLEVARRALTATQAAACGKPSVPKTTGGGAASATVDPDVDEVANKFRKISMQTGGGSSAGSNGAGAADCDKTLMILLRDCACEGGDIPENWVHHREACCDAENGSLFTDPPGEKSSAPSGWTKVDGVTSSAPSAATNKASRYPLHMEHIFLFPNPFEDIETKQLRVAAKKDLVAAYDTDPSAMSEEYDEVLNRLVKEVVKHVRPLALGGTTVRESWQLVDFMRNSLIKDCANDDAFPNIPQGAKAIQEASQQKLRQELEALVHTWYQAEIAPHGVFLDDAELEKKIETAIGQARAQWDAKVFVYDQSAAEQAWADLVMNLQDRQFAGMRKQNADAKKMLFQNDLIAFKQSGSALSQDGKFDVGNGDSWPQDKNMRVQLGQGGKESGPGEYTGQNVQIEELGSARFRAECQEEMQQQLVAKWEKQGPEFFAPKDRKSVEQMLADETRKLQLRNQMSCEVLKAAARTRDQVEKGQIAAEESQRRQEEMMQRQEQIQQQAAQERAEATRRMMDAQEAHQSAMSSMQQQHAQANAAMQQQLVELANRPPPEVRAIERGGGGCEIM
ncbi:unnamed protein product [Amoebophrya sp. A120]|nr:unnamed protein product [Amoebophrya sp. A120]|eukprot:GSA120T00019956001.1